MCVYQEFDLGEVEIDFVSFVFCGANRKRWQKALQKACPTRPSAGWILRLSH